MIFSEIEKANILRTKETLKSLLNKDPFYLLLNKTVMNNCFVAGGIFATLLREEKYNDIDVFFRYYSSREDMRSYLKNNLSSLSKFPSVEETNSSAKYAITVRESGVSYIVEQKSICGSPETIKKSFDFVHCLAHYCMNADKLFISKYTYDACMNKWLIVNPTSGLTKGTVPQYRVDKFIGLGYTWRD